MVVAVMKHMASNFAKIDKFEGVDFRRWQKKMYFLLSSMSVVYVLTTPIPKDGPVISMTNFLPSWKVLKAYIDENIIMRRLTLVELAVICAFRKSLRVAGIVTSHWGKYVDGSFRNLKKDCKGGKVDNKANGLDTNGLDDDVAWWVDSGATVHVCKDRCWFKTYESLNDGSILHMGNESTTLVHGRGCVDLRFSSGKIVSLFNILHVPNILKKLVSSSILNNYGYKQVIESNKFVLSKHGVFIGFGYLSNQMFRLNIVNDNIGSAFISTSKLNDSILWHARLGHVHFKRMQDMSKDGLIPSFDMDTEK
ncbi:zinc finger, CCHC-type containing protein, partial [Tanacetum coccineum]